jgi:hypothetical protein
MGGRRAEARQVNSGDELFSTGEALIRGLSREEVYVRT